MMTETEQAADEIEQKGSFDRTNSAIVWQAITVISRVILQVGVFAIVSRIVPVDEIGLMAEAMVVIMFLTTFSEVGLGPVLVQRKSVSESEKRTAIGIATTVGGICSLMLAAVSPFIAWCFNSPDLTLVLVALSPAFLCTSIQSAISALMKRDLHFKGLFFVETLAYAAGYAIPTVICAMLGFGVWSLVVGHLALAALQLLLICKLSGIKPSVRWDYGQAKELVSSAVSFSAARAVFYSARNADYVMIGMQMGEVPLGLYSRAYILTGIPITRIAGVLNTVLFSSYSRMSSNEQDLQRLFLRTVKQITCLLWPVLAITSVLSEQLITGLLGRNYLASVEPLSYLAIGGMFLAVHNAGDTLAKALGKNQRRIVHHTVYLILATLAAWYGSRFSIGFVALMISLVMLVQYVFMSLWTMDTLKLNSRLYFGSQLSGAMLSVVAALVALTMRSQLGGAGFPVLVLFFVCALFGLVAAGLLVGLLPSAFLEESTRQKVRKIFKRFQVKAKKSRTIVDSESR